MSDVSDDKEYIRDLKLCFGTDADTMTDEQLLTLLISYTDCRKRVVAVSTGLVKQFGSFRACFDASYDELCCVEGMTHNAAVLITLVAEIRNMKRSSYKIGEKITDIEKFFLNSVKRCRDEKFYVVAMDSKHKLLNVKKLTGGKADSVDFMISDIVDFAAYHKAGIIAVGHTHPGMGTPEASQKDLGIMETIAKVLHRLDIEFMGQVIIAEGKARLYSVQRADGEHEER